MNSGGRGRGNSRRGGRRSTFQRVSNAVKKVAAASAFSKAKTSYEERKKPPPKPVPIPPGEAVLNVDIDVGSGKKGKITVKVGDDPFELALLFCLEFGLVKSPPEVGADGKHLVGNVAKFELENRHVKTVKTHIMQFVDIVTTKKADAGAGGYKKEVVGKKGYLKEVAVYEKWKKIQERQEKIIADKKAAESDLPAAQSNPPESNKDPFSVQPQIPENKRMASVSTSEANAKLEPQEKKGRYDSPIAKPPAATLSAPTPVSAPASSTKKKASRPQPISSPAAAPSSSIKPSSTPPPSDGPKKAESSSIPLLAVGALAAAAAIGFMLMRRKK